MSTLILDNGAYLAKIGLSSTEKPNCFPNCIMKAKSERRKQYICNQIDDCKDLSSLFYVLPFQKGYLVNWDVQRQVWDHVFGKDVMNLDCSESTIIITEPYFNFLAIQEAMNEIFFEEYKFDAILRTNAGSLSAYKRIEDDKAHKCCLVVDSGFSFTHIAPYHGNKKITKAVRRISVGGKLLTNHLKEIISYRQLHVMDETYVMNQVKEDVSFVSLQFNQDMQIAKLKGLENTIVRDYVLPDFSQIKRGYVKDPSTKTKSHEQIVRMNNERFSVPEVLFHPSDVSIQEMGVPEAIINSISATPEEMHPHLYNNIILTGGNSLFPGFRERVERDVRSMAPQEYNVNVFLPKNPIEYAWHGGKLLGQSDDILSKMCVSRKEYEENGQSICTEKFDV
ncbi:actin-related protein 6-like [Anneissia japonica]|uniref:actin-related protein 6-like n=2 Tax=Anneissia japonica TaxID=1529436 RepID=UPI0014258275|nr:actin-related protein 6-like [Anneissia japonica]